MAFELDFYAVVSSDKREILLGDQSRNYADHDERITKPLVEIKAFSGGSIPDYKEVPFEYVDGSVYGENIILKLLASDINDDSSEFLLDNTYVIRITLSDSTTVFESSEDNLTDFITNEFEVLDIFLEYDYIKIGENYYLNSIVAPGGATESDFEEVLPNVVTSETYLAYRVVASYPDRVLDGFQLDFDIQVSDDKKKIRLVDQSKYFESIDPTFTEVSVKVKTYLEVFGQGSPSYVDVPFTFESGSAYEEGTVLLLDATDINPNGEVSILDNIYDVVVTLYAPYVIFESSEANLTDFITNEFEVLDIFDEYDYIKIGEVYYSNSVVGPGSANESDFNETELAPIDSIEKNNTEGVYPLSIWYIDKCILAIAFCKMTNTESVDILRLEAIRVLLMANTKYGSSEQVQVILEYLYPLVIELIDETA